LRRCALLAVLRLDRAAALAVVLGARRRRMEGDSLPACAGRRRDSSIISRLLLEV
jgi:hypothetical protein